MSDDPLPHAWPRIRAEIRRSVTEATWHLWLEGLRPGALRDGELLLEIPDDRRPWISSNFLRLLQAATDAVLGSGRAVVRLVAPGQGGGDDGRSGPASGRGRPAARALPGSPGHAFNPRLTFDQFVIGDSNRLAHGAALAVAEMPGLAYNPLFLCGPPGLGKTHLLHSIGNYLTAHGDGLTVLYTTVESFTDHFVGALHTGALDDFKSTYRSVDVLLVDDIQFLQSKERTEQEFFHTFNALHGTGAQLVLTSDRLPRDLDALEDRLRERFEAGLVCDIRPPDPATRLTILRKRVQQDGIESIDEAALDLIAARVDTNIRALEGALIRIVAFGSLTRRPVTHELATEVLDGLYPELRPRRRTIREIQESTCKAFDITLDDLLSTRRATAVAWPRQVAMYLARELTDQTLPAIGRQFGNRNHTTVMHACKRTAERMATDRDAYDAVRRLTELLGGAW